MIRRIFRYGGIIVLLAALVYVAVDSHAEPFITQQKLQDKDINLISVNPDGSRTYEMIPHPLRILDGAEYKDYKLSQDANTVTLETANAGSFSFNKNTCSYNLHKSGYVDELNPPDLRDISWTVKGKSAAASSWSSVNSINNAACVVSIQSTESTVKLIGERSSSSGIFQIVLDYIPGYGIKETFRAYNNNPAWTNHNIGFTELMTTPRIVKFGNNTYDLANYNGTVLGRNWIENNNAKLIRFTDDTFYDFGIGFDNLNDVKIMWDGTNAKLAFNYLYPTVTVPYQTWFEVDPTLNFDTAGTAVVVGLAAGQNKGGQYISDTAPRNKLLSSATFSLSRAGATGTVTAELRAVTGDVLIATSTTSYNAATIAGVQTSYTFNFATPTIPNGDFRIVAVFTPTGGTVNQYGSNANTVANQQLTYYTAAWNNDATKDARGSLVYTVPAPHSPTSMTATSVFTDSYYSWVQSNGTGTDYYIIGRSLDNMTWPQSEKIVIGNVTSYIDTDPYCSPGATCYVNVTATNTSFNSTSSAYASYTMDYPPDAITDLTITGITDSTITISFTQPDLHGHTLIGYQVNYSTPHSSNPNTIYLNTTSSTTPTISGLSTFTPYSIRVGAITDGGRNATGNIVDTQTLHPAPTFPITWQTVSNPILMDRDDDGLIDTVYSVNSTSSSTILFTKEFGSGLASMTKSFSASGGAIVVQTASFGVYGSDYIIVAYDVRRNTSCTSSINLVHVDTGTITQIATLSQSSGAGTDICAFAPYLMQRSDNRLVYFQYDYDPDTLNYISVLKANSTTLSTNTDTSSKTATITPFASDVSWNTSVYLPDTTSGTGSLNGTYGLAYFDSATSEYHNVGMGNYASSVDQNATQWNIGLKKEHQSSILTLDNPTWEEILGVLIQDEIPADEKIYYLHYKILNPTLTSEPVKTIIEISGTEYIALVSSNTLYYSRIPDISGYQFAAWLYDTYLPELGGNAASEFPPQYSIRVVFPTTTYDVSGYGIQGFLTDYRFEIPEIDRAFYPQVMNTTQVLPAILPPSSGLTAVSVHVRNAPQDAVVKVVNPTFSMLGEFYQWSAKPLLADDTFSIDLPTNSCFNVYISPDTNPRDWEDLGVLCASGTMPKQLTYLTGLSFTFWTLPWGVSTDYTPSTELLETFVRSSETPYAYYIRVYDRNGTLQISQLYSNQTGLVEQNYNISSIQKPARVEILDITNRTLYHTTLGFGNWLEDFQTFSNQHLTIDGFNLVFMMPLIFAAIWTRNTVSMGTMMTVVFIMTLVFLGIISLPEMILYMMVFIAAIGMVAYKLLY